MVCLEESLQSLPRDVVALVLQAVDVLEHLDQILSIDQLVGCAGDLRACLSEAAAHAFRSIRNGLDVVQIDLVCSLLGEVHDLIERMGKHQDVGPFERRHEGPVRQVVYLMRYVVASVLELSHDRVMAAFVVQGAAELGQGLAHELALSTEKFIEPALARNKIQFRHPTPAPRLRLPSASLTGACVERVRDGAGTAPALAEPSPRLPRSRSDGERNEQAPPSPSTRPEPQLHVRPL